MVEQHLLFQGTIEKASSTFLTPKRWKVVPISETDRYKKGSRNAPSTLKEIQSKCVSCIMITRKQLSFQAVLKNRNWYLIERFLWIFQNWRSLCFTYWHRCAFQCCWISWKQNELKQRIGCIPEMLCINMCSNAWCDVLRSWIRLHFQRMEGACWGKRVIVKLTWVQNHNRIGPCERCHCPLRAILRRI